LFSDRGHIVEDTELGV